MSSFNVKPGVDWALIKADFDSGLSLRECVKRQCERGVNISKRAIEKRRDKEGWTATARLPSVRAQESGEAITQHRGAEQAKIVLECLLSGGSLRLAAGRAGMSEDTLARWRDDDAEFAALVDRARFDAVTSNIKHIHSAAPRDWKAAAYLLERNPLTKAEYATKESGGTVIQVNVAVDRAAPETITIDHKP